ncbi:MAG: radical SAM protein [Verrucomicrobia bacterium]|nr:radical SAM protein [Verrucomicrobiota bacterium]MBI3871030.1 radical SAM protein [Verrucomicrobiota bacterium]
MVNHACNLRCSYCYTGAKFHSPMSKRIGEIAIARALGSVRSGGGLDLGFFGGEPLLEAAQVIDWMLHSRLRASEDNKSVRFHLTTNGTLATGRAWEVMTSEDLDLTISFDGLARIHDRHRRDARGQPTSALVEATLRRLIELGKPLRVNVVVRPDNLEELPEGLIHLRDLGVVHVDLSLDLWTQWNVADGSRLERFVDRAAELWRAWLPQFSLNWFDGKIGDLARLPLSEETTRCGFGDGEIAVAPSGNLYPCERLIGEDGPNHPRRLPGHVLDGREDFVADPLSFVACDPCSRCVIASVCDTRCRCSNYVRTGDVNRPDGLLCLLNKATGRAACAALTGAPALAKSFPANHTETLS